MIHAAPCAIAIAPAGYADAAESRPFGLVTGAVDGGDETERVARVAARIARRAGGSLRLVMVADVPFSHGPEFTSTLGYGSLKPEVREAAEKTLERATTAAGAGLQAPQRVEHRTQLCIAGRERGVHLVPLSLRKAKNERSQNALPCSAVPA